MPHTRTATVFLETPFHSLRTMPHTLENTTLRLIRMHQLKVIRTG